MTNTTPCFTVYFSNYEVYARSHADVDTLLEGLAARKRGWKGQWVETVPDTYSDVRVWEVVDRNSNPAAHAVVVRNVRTGMAARHAVAYDGFVFDQGHLIKTIRSVTELGDAMRHVRDQGRKLVPTYSDVNGVWVIRSISTGNGNQYDTVVLVPKLVKVSPTWPPTPQSSHTGADLASLASWDTVERLMSFEADVVVNKVEELV